MAQHPDLRTQSLPSADLRDAYQSVYDALAALYWSAPDTQSKDLVFAARERVGQLIDALNQKQLAGNTETLAVLQSRLQAANAALATIQSDIHSLTADLGIAKNVVDAISLALAFIPAL